MDLIEKEINEFYENWEYYCYPDKVEKCKNDVETFLGRIDNLQDQTNEGNKKQKARLLYLKGKILDLLPVYQKSAEDFLHKSIKLNPTNGDCWMTLGHVLFKKGDIQSSQKSFTMALEYKGVNKSILRYQSVLMRSQGKNEQQRKKNIEQSVKVIKKALLLDVKDPVTWYFLGNAYFSNFIANFKKFEELQNALKAYNEAEKYFKFKYPDLFLNRANVQSHLENYESAIKDYSIAHQIDSTTGCLQSIQKIKSRIQFTRLAFQRVAEIKGSKMEDLIKNIPNSISNNKDNLQILTIKKLKLRHNPKSFLTGKIISKISKYDDIPFSYLAIDWEGSFFTLSLYNVDNQRVDRKLTKDTIIGILHPQAKVVGFEGFNYTSLQIFEPNKLRVNDAWLTKEDFRPAQVSNKAFEK